MPQKRRTQCVSPLNRIQQGTANNQMNETQQEEAVDMADPSSHTNDNQAMLSLLKIIIENQNTQVMPNPAYNNFCHNQRPNNSCMHHCYPQSHMQNTSWQQLPDDTDATGEEPTTITSLLKTVIKNQTMNSSCTSQWNHCSAPFIQPPMSRSRPKLNSSIKQTQTVDDEQASTSNEPRSSEDPERNKLLQVILGNQAKMAARMDTLMRMQETIMKKLERYGHLEVVEQAPATFSRMRFNRLDSIEDCSEFEEKLKNPEFAEKMLIHFEPVCGSNDLKGDNLAYALVDHVFTRRFFTLFTWSGVTRGSDYKESFIKFQRVFEFFFDLVRKSDHNYTVKSLKDFFQKIISNSKRRAENRQMRASRVKHYPGAKYKKFPRESQELMNEYVTDNEYEPRDSNSMCSAEFIIDEASTTQDIVPMKAEEEED